MHAVARETFFHACGGEGNLPEVGVILPRAVLEGDCRCGWGSWGQNDAAWCGIDKCPMWREDVGSPRPPVRLQKALLAQFPETKSPDFLM